MGKGREGGQLKCVKGTVRESNGGGAVIRGFEVRKYDKTTYNGPQRVLMGAKG